MRTVLIVSDRPSLERSVEGALDEQRFEVMRCPGPHAADGQCVGTRHGHCPLVSGADVIVLDLDLETDELHEGASAGDLLAFYRAKGVPVIGIAEGAFVDHGVEVSAILRPDAAGEQIVGAIDHALEGG